MSVFFDIYGTHIPLAKIKDFRIIDVEFIFRPVYGEVKYSMLGAITGKKFEFICMQPYAAIVGQQGQKSALGEYRAKDFKEALGKDISGAMIYTIADKFKLKAFKHQKYHCVNMAGRAFTTYLDDVPAALQWNDGRIAEVYKEDPLHATLGENTMPGIQYIPALIIKADENFCFFGNGVQISDVHFEYERLKEALSAFHHHQERNLVGRPEKLVLPQIPKISLPLKWTSRNESETVDVIVKQDD